MDYKAVVFYHYLLPLDDHQLGVIPVLIQREGTAEATHSAAV